ncbi:hypothetical protein [Paenibacillus polymyxa]|uniref:hypothetical protein n=1 Tax=Paenibacillus polymyxa TaxID=1406 RepID=UPI000496564E|nr:hypothetical protein [Paenibacillus polymyxa]
MIQPEKLGRKVVVDHKDNNRLNNQKRNLRICLHKDNMKNRKKTDGLSSKYKGVHWHEKSKMWKVKITADGKHTTHGYYTNETAAANCYNYYALKFHGEFALINDCKFMSKEEWLSFKKEKDKTSSYRGVSKVGENWISQIWDNKNKRNCRIGSFMTELEAALAYDYKALEIKGDKAKLNFYKEDQKNNESNSN